jgi:hypothetical protein
MTQLKVVLAATLALAARDVVAQTSSAPVEPIPPATAPATPVPTLSPTTAPSPQVVPVAPAPQAAAPAAATDKVTADFSGWLIMQSFYNQGGLNAMDLPKLAAPVADGAYLDQDSTGVMIRQSRFRWNLGLPSDGFIKGATLKGLAEFDFAGQQGADISSWLPRIRHAFVTATWKDLNNLQVLVGQTWGVAPGPYFANSLTHIVMPRFGGAGYLFRRAPQVRVSGNVPVASGAGLSYTGAVLTPEVAEGQRSGTPHLEARIAANYKMAGKQLVDVGVYGHVGTDRYEAFDVDTVASTTTAKTVDVGSRLIGVDAKIDLPYVSVFGSAFMGQNLDAYAATAPGVRTVTALDPSDLAKCLPGAGDFCTAPGQTTRKQARVVTGVDGVDTTGWFAQATITPVKGVQLVAGYGQETPDEDTLPTATLTAPQIVKNAQLSGGVILNVTSRWRVGLEYTQYSTEYMYGGTNANKTFDASQFELGTLFAF